MKALRGFSVLVLLLSPLSVHAQVTYLAVEKTQFYNQTANNTAPGAPYSYSVYAVVDTASSGDANSFTLSDGPSIVNLFGSSTSFGGYNYYGTKAAMDAAFPSGGAFTFTANGGSLGGESDSLPVRPDNYGREMYLTGTGISDAMNLNSSSGHTFDIGYTGTGLSTSTCFAILNSSNQFIYDVSGTAAQSSYALSSAFLETLAPGEQYRGELVDFNDVGVLTHGSFSGAPNSDVFAQSTTFCIEVVPEPSVGVMIFCGLGLLIFLKARRMPIGSRGVVCGTKYPR